MPATRSSRCCPAVRPCVLCVQPMPALCGELSRHPHSQGCCAAWAGQGPGARPPGRRRGSLLPGRLVRLRCARLPPDCPAGLPAGGHRPLRAGEAPSAGSRSLAGASDHRPGDHETFVQVQLRAHTCGGAPLRALRPGCCWQVEQLQRGLCGRSRPHFFRGVATVRPSRPALPALSGTLAEAPARAGGRQAVQHCRPRRGCLWAEGLPAAAGVRTPLLAALAAERRLMRRPRRCSGAWCGT